MASNSSAPERLEARLNGPAGTPPPGVLPNFDNPPNGEVVIHITTAIFIIFTSLAVLIRIYTRKVLLRSVGYDDYTSIIAWLSLIAFLVLGLFATKAGAGIHMWDLRLKSFFRLLYRANLFTIVYNPTAFFAKLSILLLYSRIFNSTKTGNLTMFVAIRVGIASVFLFYFVRLFFDIFQCNPREKIWNKAITGGHCYDGNATYKATGIFNVISDFAILIIPVASVWRLNMSSRRKLLVIGVFASGFLTCLTSIVRTYYTWQVVKSSDTSYLFGNFGIWSEAELSAGVITGCLPVMPKFFQHVGPKVYKALSFQSKFTNNSSHDPRARSKPSTVDAITKVKGSIIKHTTILSTSESETDPYAQLHGEYYTLEESEPSQSQAKMTWAPTQAPGVGIATRRDDLEYGHQKS